MESVSHVQAPFTSAKHLEHVRPMFKVSCQMLAHVPRETLNKVLFLLPLSTEAPVVPVTPFWSSALANGGLQCRSPFYLSIYFRSYRKPLNFIKCINYDKVSYSGTLNIFFIFFVCHFLSNGVCLSHWQSSLSMLISYLKFNTVKFLILYNHDIFYSSVYHQFYLG